MIQCICCGKEKKLEDFYIAYGEDVYLCETCLSLSKQYLTACKLNIKQAKIIPLIPSSILRD